MPEFPKPTFSYEYDPVAQIDALREYEQDEPGRDVPAKAANRLLIATWNIANLGAHDRRDKDHRLMAEILSWFDVIALQEVRDNLGDLLQIQSLPASYDLLFTDPSGKGLPPRAVPTVVRILMQARSTGAPPEDSTHPWVQVSQTRPLGDGGMKPKTVPQDRLRSCVVTSLKAHIGPDRPGARLIRTTTSKVRRDPLLRFGITPSPGGSDLTLYRLNVWAEPGHQ